jgi:hypothetical protein
MKLLMVISAAAALALAQTALAQNQPSNSPASPNSPAASQSAKPDQNVAAAKQIQQDLTSAGFQDVRVVAQSFVVQAKTKNGDPVVMTIGPHGMSVFEAMSSSGLNSSPQSGTTGSATPPGGTTSK